MREASVREAAESQGLRLTRYRSAVLAALQQSHDHPTASAVFRRVRRRHPGVAYATIYNALNWLKRRGLVAEMKINGGASRFDPITERHDHLVCTRCGALADYALELPRKVWAGAGRGKGFRVERYRLELFGLCSRCQRRAR